MYEDVTIAFRGFWILDKEWLLKQPGAMMLPVGEWLRGSVAIRELQVAFGCLC